MEKTLTISGIPIRFRSSAKTLLIYKRQFNREFLTDVSQLMQAVQPFQNRKKKLSKEDVMNNFDFSRLNTDLLFGAAWALAKTADEQTENFEEWLDHFESISLTEFLPLVTMVSNTLKTDRKNE